MQENDHLNSPTKVVLLCLQSALRTALEVSGAASSLRVRAWLCELNNEIGVQYLRKSRT